MLRMPLAVCESAGGAWPLFDSIEEWYGIMKAEWN